MKIVDVNSMRIEADKWNPEFQSVSDVGVCADLINIPHRDDYPQFVNSTKEVIQHGIENFTKKDTISEREIKQIHRLIFVEKDYIKVGNWRHTNVHIINDDDSIFEPPEAYLVPQLIMSICPIEIGSMTKEDLILWYKRFEIIHPFQDGNGRVGGVIMAIISYINFGEFLTPK